MSEIRIDAVKVGLELPGSRAADSPDGGVEAGEQADQSPSPVRVRQQPHVVVCGNTTLDPEGNTHTHSHCNI